ncbi:hypothetical protein Gpo141_00002614 [Globisporangium polare]
MKSPRATADEQQQQQTSAESMEVDASTAGSVVSESGTVSSAEEVAMDEAKGGSASDSTVDAVESKKVAAADNSNKKCPICSKKGKISAGCIIQACKSCCLSKNDDCVTHAKKDLMTKLLTNEKPKKPVLKREFKETNIMYYEETVAIFCVRDFFASKKMSQGILNDQVRSLRVKGTYEGKQQSKKARVRDSEAKARIASVLSKGGAPFSPRHITAVE